MSYSIIGTFYDKEHKPTQFKDVDFDRLKVLNERTYSVSFEDVESVSMPDVIVVTRDGTESKCFTLDNFLSARAKLQTKRDQHRRQQAILDSMKESGKYYGFTSVGMERFDSDREYHAAMLEETVERLHAVQYVIDVFDFLESVLETTGLVLCLTAV